MNNTLQVVLAHKIDGTCGRKFNWISDNLFQDNLLTVTFLDSWSILLKIFNVTDFFCTHHKSDYLFLCPLYKSSLPHQYQAYENHEPALSRQIMSLDWEKKPQYFKGLTVEVLILFLIRSSL